LCSLGLYVRRFPLAFRRVRRCDCGQGPGGSHSDLAFASLASRATNCRVERTGIHGIPSTTASRSGSASLSSNAQEAYRAITRQLAVASGNRVNASKAAMRIGYEASSSMRSNGVASVASSVSPCGSGCPLLTRHVPLGEATHDQADMPPALDVFEAKGRFGYPGLECPCRVPAVTRSSACKYSALGSIAAARR
jgi:hypothetical protein